MYVYNSMINIIDIFICLLNFQGIRMWALNGYTLVPGYPKYIHRLGFPKSVRKIDAAVHIYDTGKTLFFTDEDYWRYFFTSYLIFGSQHTKAKSEYRGCRMRSSPSSISSTVTMNRLAPWIPDTPSP